MSPTSIYINLALTTVKNKNSKIKKRDMDEESKNILLIIIAIFLTLIYVGIIFFLPLFEITELGSYFNYSIISFVAGLIIWFILSKTNMSTYYILIFFTVASVLLSVVMGFSSGFIEFGRTLNELIKATEQTAGTPSMGLFSLFPSIGNPHILFLLSIGFFNLVYLFKERKVWKWCILPFMIYFLISIVMINVVLKSVVSGITPI